MTSSSQRLFATSGAASARLRDAIDHGRTGDKVDWPDPAAAPLGTDEEAAGISPPARAVEQTATVETARPVRPPRRGGRIGAAWLLIVLLVLAIAAAFGWIATSG